MTTTEDKWREGLLNVLVCKSFWDPNSVDPSPTNYKDRAVFASNQLLGSKCLGRNKNQSSLCNTVGTVASVVLGWKWFGSYFSGLFSAMEIENEKQNPENILSNTADLWLFETYSLELRNSSCDSDHVFTFWSLNTCWLHSGRFTIFCWQCGTYHKKSFHPERKSRHSH